MSYSSYESMTHDLVDNIDDKLFTIVELLRGVDITQENEVIRQYIQAKYHQTPICEHISDEELDRLEGVTYAIRLVYPDLAKRAEALMAGEV